MLKYQALGLKLISSLWCECVTFLLPITNKYAVLWWIILCFWKFGYYFRMVIFVLQGKNQLHCYVLAWFLFS